MTHNRIVIPFALLTALMLLIGWLSPSAMNFLYGELIYPSVRLTLNTLSWLFPIPLFKVFIILVLTAIGRGVFFRLKKRRGNVGNRWLNVLWYMLRTGIIIACGFYWIWGFNYLMPSPVEQLGLSTKPVPAERVNEMLYAYTDSVNKLRAELYDEGFENSENFFELTVDYDRLAEYLNRVLAVHGFKQYSSYPLRHWRPKGVLLRNSTAGMYFPFTGEATIDPGLHPLQLPFTSSHEMGHSAGFTDEGFCNLLAYLATTRSEDPFIRYSGFLTFWRYLARAARSFDREFYSEFIEENLSELVVGDLQSIYENRAKYPDWFPGLQRRVYDSYLRAHGVTEGVASYNQMIILAESYEKLYRK